MLLFWILAGLVSSGAALLILLRAARAARGRGPDDPTLDVYRRQLAEIDELADRGLLGGAEHKAARAEAGRRLLGEADRPGERTPGPAGQTTRRLVLAAAVAAPILALGAYLTTGAPGLPDMPYASRLESWKRLSATDPAHLTLPQMAAVLASQAKSKPDDPQPLYFLAVVERAEGDIPSAIRDLEKSAELDPKQAKVWAGLGMALVEQDQGEVGASAAEAFRRAVALDPAAVQPRYFLARGEIAGGRLHTGLADWRALLASLPPDDTRRAVLQNEIDQVARTGKLDAAQAPAASAPPAETGQEAAFIQSMVDRLAARLKSQPDDPQGWARLIRAYGVLHQTDRRAAAIAEAQRLFKDRPDALRTALQGHAAPALPPPQG